MKILKFKPHLIEPILRGNKTSTWRLFDDKDLKQGDPVQLLNWETREPFAIAEIIRLREKRLGEIHTTDFEGHETYETPEAMLAHYRGYYGDRVTMETPIKIVEFKVLPL